jgi:predicted dehydrogenase
MRERYRVAIAGCHRMLDREPAAHNWAAGFAAVPRAELIAVYDRDDTTRQTFVDCWGAMPAFDDYAAMLVAIQPDIVCLATSQTRHADQIELAAAAGVRGILCEKPLATSMAEVDRIVAACERHRIVLAFGVTRRWYPSYRALAGMLREGLVGTIQVMTAFGLPSLLNLGCHWFDRVLDFAGDPEVAWVSGTIDRLMNEPLTSPRHLDPPGSCQIGFANGVETFVTASGPSLGFDIAGSAGRLIIMHDGATPLLWTMGAENPAPIALPLAVPAWPLVVEDLLDALDRDGETLAGIAVARRVTEIGLGVHHSHHLGGQRVRPSEIDRALRVASFRWGND